MQRSTTIFSLLILFSALLLVRCAHPVSPTGGPRDVTPPVVEGYSPPNLTKRFREKSFRIEFNEYVTLKNQATEVFSSPPMRHEPDIRVRGKSITVKLIDSLVSDATYSINFGNAITDLTEGNILKGFSYVFSTGDIIDTLSLQGTLQSAFDRKPQKEVFIGLYMNNNDTIAFDSLPLKVAPYYITKTDEQGNFLFNHLQ